MVFYTMFADVYIHNEGKGGCWGLPVADSGTWTGDRHATGTGLEVEPVPGGRHIIFLETLCVLNGSVRDKPSGLAISQRQACAIASAANTNPDSKV
jgi:hypothetical protein